MKVVFVSGGLPVPGLDLDAERLEVARRRVDSLRRNMARLEQTSRRTAVLLKKMLADGGLQFENHAAVVPVCGPSRSSLLAGRYPHNVGYVANTAAASREAWAKLQDDTIGTWMTKAGYYTAFLGKYVNGLECDIPKGWNHWGGLTCMKYRGQPLGGTYNYLNASQWHVDFDEAGQQPLDKEPRIAIREGVHQSVFLAEQTVELHVDQYVPAPPPHSAHRVRLPARAAPACTGGCSLAVRYALGYAQRPWAHSTYRVPDPRRSSWRARPSSLASPACAKMAASGGAQRATTTASSPEADSCFPAALHARKEPPRQNACFQGPECCRQAGPKAPVSPRVAVRQAVLHPRDTRHGAAAC